MFVTLILVLMVWGLWVPPLAPLIWWNVAWFDLFLVGLLVALLLSAATSSPRDRSAEPPKTEALRQYEEREAQNQMNMFFWAFSVALLVLIVIGYFALVPEITH